jgi:hypothetical protein
MALSRLEHVPASSVWNRPRARSSPRAWVTIAAWWRAAELDRQLAAGASPRASGALAERARRLTSARSRRRLADGLAGTLRRAQDGATGLTSAVRPHRREVLAARHVVVALDRRLRSTDPVTARGMAMLQMLLVDGNSALYQPTEPGALGSMLRAAAASLEPTRQGAPS